MTNLPSDPAPAMGAVLQRTKTDCLTACIATVTAIPYEDCPQLWEYTGMEWVRHLGSWARDKGFSLLYWENPGSDNWPVMDGITVIAGGKVKRSADYLHAVVMKAEWDSVGHRTNLSPIFDPSGKDFIDTVEHLIAFIPATSLYAQLAAAQAQIEKLEGELSDANACWEAEHKQHGEGISEALAKITALEAHGARLREALTVAVAEMLTISDGKTEVIRNDSSSGEAYGWLAAYEHVKQIADVALAATPDAAMAELLALRKVAEAASGLVNFCHPNAKERLAFDAARAELEKAVKRG